MGTKAIGGIGLSNWKTGESILEIILYWPVKIPVTTPRTVPAVNPTKTREILIKTSKKKLPLVVIIGAENKGISLLTQKKCDYLLKIPLKGKTSSLNASVAAAISFFHLGTLLKKVNACK